MRVELGIVCMVVALGCAIVALVRANQVQQPPVPGWRRRDFWVWAGPAIAFFLLGFAVVGLS